MRHLINILDFSTEELQELVDVANDIIANPGKYSEVCRGKKLATLFFEPSTRTRLSFEAAMYELGGNVLSVPSGNSSSAAKGESVADTAKVVSCYADIIAMRHPKEGAPLVAAHNAEVPIINAGDGGHFHPTQTLTDLMTIHRKKGEIGNFTVGLTADWRLLAVGDNGCGQCANVCPYGAISYVDKDFRGPNRTTITRHVSQVNSAMCQGCGACTVACPSGAMDLQGFSNKQILAEVDSVL